MFAQGSLCSALISGRLLTVLVKEQSILFCPMKRSSANVLSPSQSHTHYCHLNWHAAKLRGQKCEKECEKRQQMQRSCFWTTLYRLSITIFPFKYNLNYLNTNFKALFPLQWLIIILLLKLKAHLHKSWTTISSSIFQWELQELDLLSKLGIWIKNYEIATLFLIVIQ